MLVQLSRIEKRGEWNELPVFVFSRRRITLEIQVDLGSREQENDHEQMARYKFRDQSAVRMSECADVLV